MSKGSKSIKRRFTVGFVVAALALLSSTTSSANAPASQYTIAGGVVTDNMTGLKWQQTLSPSSYTFSGAGTYCGGTIASSTGWRIPSLRELATLVDRSKTSPAIDATAFPSTPSVQFWTSSVNGTYAFWLDFTDGSFNSTDTSYMTPPPTLRVRCVK